MIFLFTDNRLQAVPQLQKLLSCNASHLQVFRQGVNDGHFQEWDGLAKEKYFRSTKEKYPRLTKDGYPRLTKEKYLRLTKEKYFKLTIEIF